MNLFYSLSYRFGFTPWERAAAHPPAADHVARLFDDEERGRQPPFGRALDVGCGSGHWSVVLAQRGWQVVGVDVVPAAVEAARARVRVANLDIEIVQADVTRLRTAGIDPGFRLIWDFGTIHGLTQAQRGPVGRELTGLAAADAALLMLVWAPARRGPLPRGASRGDLEQAFPHWEITGEQPFDATGLPRPLRSADPRIYRLCLRDRQSSA